jgi:hypothetical protein
VEGGDGTQVEAIPDYRCHFVDWSDGSTANPRTDTGVTGDIDVTANFAADFAAVTLDGTPTRGTGDTTASSVSFSHTTGTGTDRLLLAGVAWNCSTTDRTITSVTFTPSGGSAIPLTAVKTQQAGTQLRYSAIYKLLDPPKGVTGTVTVTFSGAVAYGSVAGAADFAGVDQGDPLGTAAGAGSQSQGTAPAVTLTGLTGDELVFDSVFMGGTGSTQTLTAGTGQTAHWNTYSPSLCTGAASTEQATGSPITMSWTAGTSAYWAIAAVPIRPRQVTAPTAISVTAPTGTTPAKQGDGLPVSWTPNAAVASGQFSLWVVSTTNGWYGGKIVNATGAASYTDSVDLNVPVDSGYRIFVYYRATSSDPWGVYGFASGTVSVTAGFSSITVTAPTGTSSQAQGASLPVSWTPNASMASGEFSIWVVSQANGWYVGKIVTADLKASYTDSVDLNVPVDSGYRVYVYYRATSSDPWGIYGMSPGTVDVTATGLSAISVTAPTGTSSKAQGASLPVNWTPNYAVASGQFSIWVVSQANGWYVGKIVSATGAASYADSVTLNVPVDAGYRVFVYYRATSGDPWGIYGYASGTVNVSGT